MVTQVIARNGIQLGLNDAERSQDVFVHIVVKRAVCDTLDNAPGPVQSGPVLPTSAWLEAEGVVEDLFHSLTVILLVRCRCSSPPANVLIQEMINVARTVREHHLKRYLDNRRLQYWLFARIPHDDLLGPKLRRYRRQTTIQGDKSALHALQGSNGSN